MRSSVVQALSLASVTAILWAPTSGIAIDRGARPTGLNCALAKPPVDAGEETGRGMFLQVYPRIGNIGRTYSGCQAVFITTKHRPATLAWLVEVREGDPVRVWSEEVSMSHALSCRFRRGVLVAGDPKVCKHESAELLPSKPAGCAFANPERDVCKYDAE